MSRAVDTLLEEYKVQQAELATLRETWGPTIKAGREAARLVDIQREHVYALREALAILGHEVEQ